MRKVVKNKIINPINAGIEGEELIKETKKVYNLDTTIDSDTFPIEYPLGLSQYFIDAPNSAPLVFIGEDPIILHDNPVQYPLGLSPYNDIYKSVNRIKEADNYLFDFANANDLSDKEKEIFEETARFRKKYRYEYLYNMLRLRTQDLSMKLAVNFMNNLIRVFPGFKDIWRSEMNYAVDNIFDGLYRIIPTKFYTKDKIFNNNGAGKISFLNNFTKSNDEFAFDFPSRNDAITQKSDPELFKAMYTTMHNNFLYDINYTTITIPEIVDYIMMSLYTMVQEEVSHNIVMWESTYPEYFGSKSNNEPNYDKIFVRLMDDTFEVFNTMKANCITALYMLRDHIRRFEVLDYEEMKRPIPEDKKPKRCNPEIKPVQSEF